MAFRECIQSVIAGLQAEAGELMMKSVTGGYVKDAEAKAQEATHYQFVLDLLNQVESGEFELYTTNLKVTE